MAPVCPSIFETDISPGSPGCGGQNPIREPAKQHLKNIPHTEDNSTSQILKQLYGVAPLVADPKIEKCVA